MPVAAHLFYFAYLPQSAVGHPVVFIHGAGGAHLFWPTELRRLPGVQVYAPDLPGHGKSVECNGQKTIAGFADALSDWMTAIGLDQAVLVGHSMGGAIALSMALRAPQRVLGLGCFGTATQFRVNSVLIEAAANPDSYQQAINQIVAWSFAPTAPKRLVELAGLRMKATRPDQLYADLLACQAFDIRQQIARVSAPALVLCGEQDKMTPLHYSQALAGALPNSRLVVIEGAGHMVMLERPQAVAKALTEFLQEI